jgi:hypothetical protein
MLLHEPMSWTVTGPLPLFTMLGLQFPEEA